MSDGLTWQVLPGERVATLTLTGVLDRVTRFELVTTVHKLLLDHRQLLIDLTDLRLQWAPAIRAFTTALARAGGWPSTRLALFGADEATTLLQASCPWEIHVGVDRRHAEALLARRPRRIRRTIELPDTSDAPRFARALIVDACADWALTAIEDHVQLVAHELISNAVHHAPGRHRLYLTLDPVRLTIGVSDSSPHPPRPRPDSDTRLDGLSIIAAFSRNWGTSPHRTGKTVWAVLRIPPSGATRTSTPPPAVPDAHPLHRVPARAAVPGEP
ncbi:ATP-binding protein [Pseudonocardia sp. NPDC049154]|uniref:ATP-binding protein n=1 Tax=Pseudonocardia sp. NPDC049154 TaxID=3155501 RepID=UPI0033D6CE97